MRDEYIKYMKEVITYKDAITTALEKGEAKGRAEGRIEAKAEGRAEEKAEVAKCMLLKGKLIEEITEFTGLSAEEIKQLK